MPINYIFFDVGGTLIYPDMERLMAPLLQRVRPTPEQLAAADRAAKFAMPRNGDDAPAKPARTQTGPTGQQPGATTPSGITNGGHWYVYFDTLLKSLGCCQELLPQLAGRAGDSSYWTLVAPGATEIIQRLKQRCRLGVISNADGRIRQVLERGGLAEFFDDITDSGLVGYEKPDVRIFQAALQAMGARPDESLYVGDIYPVDYQGATAAGMQALLIDPAGVYEAISAPRIRSLAELEPFVQKQGSAGSK